MAFQFSKHYTVEQARKLLPQLKNWLNQLVEVRCEIEDFDQRHRSLNESFFDFGSSMVNRWVENLAKRNDLLVEFQKKEIQIKDIERGLIDFPAVIGGKEVFLCWEKDDQGIEFWHDLDSGFPGRKPI
ncbi:MAG TPA: DUF2203 family protein [Verrucomicrobiales bacterium]|nr:DUF2203 family protein [Verrucomicrobiales bacterium]